MYSFSMKHNPSVRSRHPTPNYAQNISPIPRMSVPPIVKMVFHLRAILSTIPKLDKSGRNSTLSTTTRSRILSRKRLTCQSRSSCGTTWERLRPKPNRSIHTIPASRFTIRRATSSKLFESSHRERLMLLHRKRPTRPRIPVMDHTPLEAFHGLGQCSRCNHRIDRMRTNRNTS